MKLSKHELNPDQPDPELLDEIPCSDVSAVDGAVHVYALPTPSQIGTFVDRVLKGLDVPDSLLPAEILASDASVTVTDADELDQWWGLPVENGELPFATSPEGIEPFANWKKDLNEVRAAWVGECCEVLGGRLARFLVSQLKTMTRPDEAGVEQPIYSPDLGYFPTWRYLPERLWDRLHINVYQITDFSGTTETYRLGAWWGSDHTLHTPLITRFAGRDAQNPALLVRERMETGVKKSLLATIVGAGSVPDCMSLPLYWPEAVYSGVAPNVMASLPPAVRADMTQALETAQLTLLQWQSSRFDSFGWASFGPVASAMSGLVELCFAVPADVAIGLGFGSKLVTDASELLNAFHSAAVAVYINDSLAIAIQALADVHHFPKVVNKLTGLEGSAYYGLALGLSGDTADADGEGLEPMVLLGPTFLAYADAFSATTNGFAPGARSTGTVWSLGDESDYSWQVPTSQTEAQRLWNDWVSISGPTRQLAALFDSIGMIVEQLIYLDDALLAMADMAFSEGVVGNLIRTMLQEAGLDYATDVLGGASPGQIARYAVRQLLTDLFIDHALAEGWAEKDSCLYEIFCWMNSETKRTEIAEVFGEVGTLRDLGFPEGAPPFYVRTLPNGALLRALAAASAAVQGSSTPADVNAAVIAAIVPGDLCKIRRWLASARQDCLSGLVDGLRPDFDAAENHTLPYSPEHVIDHQGFSLNGLNVVREWSPNGGGLLLGELDEDPTPPGRGI